MTEQDQRDPWALDPEEMEKMEKEEKIGGGGVFCPKRNISIDGKCNACITLSKIFGSHVKGDPAWRMAGRKSAKVSYYLNVVLPENQDKSIVLEIFKRAGNELRFRVKNGEWLDIANPLAGEGREMRITKRRNEDGYNEYPVDPSLEKAEWAISQEVIDNLPNLDQANLIKMIKEDSIEIMKISALKQDTSLIFRICPPWDNGAGNKRILTPVYRHWGDVTEAEVNGDVEMDLSLEPSFKPKEEDLGTQGQANWNSPTDQTIEVDDPIKEEEKEVSGVSREPCFGHSSLFEPESTDCKACKEFAACGRAVLKSKKE